MKNIASLELRTSLSKFFLVAVALLLVAGCQSTSSGLAQKDVRKMRLTSIDVGYASGVKRHPELNLPALVRQELAQRVKPQLNGTRPVKLQVRINKYRLPDAGQTLLIGGSPKIAAHTVLIDANSGKRLSTANIVGAGPSQGGIGAIIGSAMLGGMGSVAAKGYARKVLIWITGSDEFGLGF